MGEPVTPSQESLDTTWFNTVGVGMSAAITSGQICENFFISDKEVFIPEKEKVGRCYRGNVILKTKKEVKALIKAKKAKILDIDEDAKFFVYNERNQEIVPFRKNDYLMYDTGYTTFDGNSFYYYDNHGNEIGTDSPVDQDSDPYVDEIKRKRPKKKK